MSGEPVSYPLIVAAQGSKVITITRLPTAYDEQPNWPVNGTYGGPNEMRLSVLAWTDVVESSRRYLWPHDYKEILMALYILVSTDALGIEHLSSNHQSITLRLKGNDAAEAVELLIRQLRVFTSLLINPAPISIGGLEMQLARNGLLFNELAALCGELLSLLHTIPTEELRVMGTYLVSGMRGAVSRGILVQCPDAHRASILRLMLPQLAQWQPPGIARTDIYLAYKPFQEETN